MPNTHAFTEFSGIEYLKIDIAGNFGLDKENWDTRIAWVDQHETQLEELLNQAEEPALYYAGVQAYRKAQQGLPTGYPVSLDATASGLQLLACLTGCEASARLCNVVPTGNREDAYTNLYRIMCDKVGDKARIARKDVKQACMTSLYGSTAEPKRCFGEGELLNVFYQTMESAAPGAWNLNQSLLALWQPYALSHDWVLPDNFHVHVKVMIRETRYVHFQNEPIEVHLSVNQGTKEGLSLPANITHSVDGMVVREMHRRCSFDTDQIIQVSKALLEEQRSWGRGYGREEDDMVTLLWGHYLDSGFLSARILDYLDVWNMQLVDPNVILKLLKSMPEKSFPILSVHDCFRCHPNNANDLRRQYNQILSEIARSDLLSFIVSQIAGTHIPVTKSGDISEAVLSADYALS